MSRKEYKNELYKSLSQLETCLETPLVAGELPSWATSVRDAFARVGPALLRQISELHADEFVEIAEQASGLLTRVEQLKHEDSEIVEQFKDLSDRASKLAKVAWRVEPDEGRLREEVSQVVEIGLISA